MGARNLEVFVAGNTKDPKKVVVLLHGIGMYGETFASFIDAVAQHRPDALILAPSGPIPVTYSPEKAAQILENDPDFKLDKARSWFPTNPASWPKLGLNLVFNSLPATHLLNKLIDQTLQTYGLRDSDLLMFGFSQGAMMALYTAMGRQKPCAGVIAHSGMYMGLATPTSRPEILLITGADDPITNNRKSIVTRFMYHHENALARLQRAGFPVTERIFPGLGHYMNKETIKLCFDFMDRVFSPPPAATPAAHPPAPTPP